MVKTDYSLIGRRSELWRRYQWEEPIAHERMGYSIAAEIVEVAEEVTNFMVGDAVAAVAPHAKRVTMEVVDLLRNPQVVHLPEGIGSETGTFCRCD